MSTALFRGEGGTEWEMDLPLSKAMQEQFDAGKLVRLSELTDAELAAQALPDPGVDADDSDGDDGDDDVPSELKAFLDTPPEAPPAKPRSKQK